MTDNVIAKTVLNIQRCLSAIDPPHDVYQLRHIKKSIKAIGSLDNVYLLRNGVLDLWECFKEEINVSVLTHM